MSDTTKNGNGAGSMGTLNNIITGVIVLVIGAILVAFGGMPSEFATQKEKVSQLERTAGAEASLAAQIPAIVARLDAYERRQTDEINNLARLQDTVTTDTNLIREYGQQIEQNHRDMETIRGLLRSSVMRSGPVTRVPPVADGVGQ